jgi:hypothetical protein
VRCDYEHDFKRELSDKRSIGSSVVGTVVAISSFRHPPQAVHLDRKLTGLELVLWSVACSRTRLAQWITERPIDINPGGSRTACPSALRSA